MIPDSMRATLKNLIVLHEGKRNYPYPDTDNPPNITIGIGYNLTARGLPDTWINDQYEADVNYFYDQLNADFTWFKNLNEARQMALIDMSFMGYHHFCEFTNMLAALANEDYEHAADQMLNSKWALQVPSRANKLAGIIRTGAM